MARIIGGLVAGLVAAFAAIWLVELIGHQFYPMPPVDVTDRAALEALIASLPTGAMLFVAFAWFCGALVGGAVAARISHRRWAAWAIAAIVALAAILNVLMLPHPVWMQIAALVAPLLGGWLAGHAARPDAVVGTPDRAEPADAEV